MLPKPDPYIKKYHVWFIEKYRKTVLTGKDLYPGFYYWTLEKGLIGPFPTVTACILERKEND